MILFAAALYFGWLWTNCERRRENGEKRAV